MTDEPPMKKPCYPKPSPLLTLLPTDLLRLIVRCVSELGVPHLLNLKLSCKRVNVVCEEDATIKCARLDDVPISPFSLFTNTPSGICFFNHYVASGNLVAISKIDLFADSLVRQGLIKFVRDFNKTGGLLDIFKANHLGNLDAKYAGGILLCFTRDDAGVEMGKSMILGVKEEVGTELEDCINSLMDMLDGLQIHPRLKRNRRRLGVCAKVRQIGSWEWKQCCGNIPYALYNLGYEDTFVCEVCFCDRERAWFERHLNCNF